MMKTISTAIVKVVSVGLFGLTICSLSHAVLGTYNFTLKGNATTATCGVEEGDANKYVTLGKTSTRFLKTPGDRGPRIPIPFNLSLCPAGVSVTFTFSGQQDTVNNQLLALSNLNDPNTAKHVAIEISDNNYNRVPISKASKLSNETANKSRPFPVDANGKVSTIFYANYMATDGAATAGIANANAEFWIEYQ